MVCGGSWKNELFVVRSFLEERFDMDFKELRVVVGGFLGREEM